MAEVRNPHQLTENVKLLQKAVVVHKGRVLLLQRDDTASSRPSKWDLPGGNSEWPTTQQANTTSLHQADISREIKEETGITVVPGHFNRDAMVYFDTTFYNEVFTVLTGWVAELPFDFDESEVTLSEEHTAFEWVPFDDARDYDFDYGKNFIVPMLRNAQEKFSE